MKRSSPYFNLKYRVDCRPPGQVFFETIVAFNNDRVALKYADDCERAHRGGGYTANGKWEYRVLVRRGNRWVEITEEEGY